MLDRAKYFLLFLMLGTGPLLVAVWQGGIFYVGLWGTCSLWAIAVAYLLAWPGLFHKRPDGTSGALATAFLAPYLVPYRGVWHLLRVVRRRTEGNYDAVFDNVLVGRRLLPAEVDFVPALVVDLTCEAPECEPLRTPGVYLGVPTLDALAPTPQQLVDIAQAVARTEGLIYVHCAEGHGRAGTVAVAIALARGKASSVQDAIAYVQHKRPGIGLQHGQRAAAAQALPRLLALSAHPDSCARP